MKQCYPKLITKEELKIVSDQMAYSICQIIKKERNYEIGFFIYIKYLNKKLPFLMTKNNIIDKDKDNILNVIINNKIKILKLGDIRYFSNDYDISLIEIEENKEDKIKFIEFDNNIYNNDLKNDYYKRSIYIIQDNKKDISVSFGRIEGIIKTNIKYSCYINTNSKSLPIFDLTNNKIIGIHKKKSKYNEGILIKNIIRDFKTSCKNEIDLLINIKSYEINKKIYFLDNYDTYHHDYYSYRNYDNYHNNLKELNDLNTELYINNIKCKYNKYFIPKNEGKYNIKLKFNINIKDCSYMFANCENIEKINLIDFKTDDIINMQYMFYGCNIKEIDLLSFNTKNVINMNNMFEKCKNIKYLDISFFDINNIIDISGLFKGCSSLILLSDISKWNIEKINNISSLFDGCSSLKSLPDISKWNMKNINNISGIIKGCSSLVSLPDILKWNINNINNMSGIFQGLTSLKLLPDIFKWNMENIKDINQMFKGCSSLISLPDISNWNT